MAKRDAEALADLHEKLRDLERGLRAAADSWQSSDVALAGSLRHLAGECRLTRRYIGRRFETREESLRLVQEAKRRLEHEGDYEGD